MICNLRNHKILAGAPRLAEHFRDRLFGMLGYSSFSECLDAMIFPRCRAVHCFFMRMTIDVIFLDKENRVVKLCPCVKPWRLCSGGFAASCTVELPAGTIENSGTKPGDMLDCKYFFTETPSASEIQEE